MILRIMLLILMIFNVNCIQLSSYMVQIGSNAVLQDSILSVLVHIGSLQNGDIRGVI